MRMRRLCVLAISLATVVGMPAFADTIPPMPIVQVCLDAKGQIETAEIVQTSTYADIDAAALKVARASRFERAANSKEGERSCIRFKVRFVLKDGELVPEAS